MGAWGTTVLENDGSLDKIYNQTVKKVTNDYETMSFNTAISQMMIFINSAYKEEILPKEYAEGFLKLLNKINSSTKKYVLPL